MSATNSVLPSRGTLPASELLQNDASIPGDNNRIAVGPFEYLRLGDVLQKVSKPVSLVPNETYREIGIRSHGKGIFHKEPVNGSALGEKRVFRVEQGCLVLNIVFAWEQAVALTSRAEEGMIASHRFPMYRAKGDVDLGFLLQFFKTREGRSLLAIASPGGAGRNKTLNQEDFEDIRLLAPSLPEQRRIADALDAWDRAIATTEALIMAKRKLFSSVLVSCFPKNLQNLPSGWTTGPVASLAEIRFSGVDKKSSKGEQSVRLCNYIDVFHNHRITDGLPFMEATATRREVAALSLRLGDVVFTKDSETPEEIAECAFVAAPLDNVICGYHLGIARARPDVIRGEFLALAMRHPRVRHEFSKRANGVTRFGLNLDALDEVELFYPSLERQSSITAALNVMEYEIDLLEQRREFLNRQKHGLMQKLLTGEWRMNGDEVQANKPARAAS
jgi:type I restriction enzyme S subunit